MKKSLSLALMVAGLLPLFSNNVENKTEVNGAVLNLSAQSLAGKVEDGAAVIKWPAVIGPDLVYNPNPKQKPPVFVLKSPFGNPAVHFTANTCLGIRGFSKQYLAGKSFTIFVRSIPVVPDFGICGNIINGDGGIPRLYLSANSFIYDQMANNISVSANKVLNKETLCTYIYDAELSTMKFMVNSVLVKERESAKKVNSFGGDALAVPFLAAGKPQEGYLLNLVIFERVLNENEIKQVTEQITKD
jgi:hypothetical protein